MIYAVMTALVIALVMGIAGRCCGGRGFFTLALLWCAYAAYEYLMYARVLCTGELQYPGGFAADLPGIAIGQCLGLRRGVAAGGKNSAQKSVGNL